MAYGGKGGTHSGCAKPGDRGDASNRAGRSSISSISGRGAPAAVKKSDVPEASPSGGEWSGNVKR
jgi:hypothetical protein